MASSPSPLAQPGPWNAVAPGYTEHLLPMFLRYAEDALRLAAPARTASVLDVAAGPGTLALLAAKKVAKVVAVDFSTAMIARLRMRAASMELTNVEAEVADGQRLAIEGETFDAAFSMFGLMFFPDRGQGFRELRRVLKPGGVAVVSSWTPLSENPVLDFMFQSLREVAGLPPDTGKLPLSTTEEMTAEMTAAGFAPVEVHQITHEAQIASIDEFWAANLAGSAPLAALRLNVGEERFAEVAAGVLERLRGKFGTGAMTMAWPALLGVGHR